MYEATVEEEGMKLASKVHLQKTLYICIFTYTELCGVAHFKLQDQHIML